MFYEANRMSHKFMERKLRFTLRENGIMLEKRLQLEANWILHYGI